MPLRSSWRGFLRLSLVSVPVKAYTASAAGDGKIHLNQLHEPCHSRIRYQKVCPIHGEVSSSEIVSGYEHAKGQYVVVEPEELERVRTESERAVNIDRFVPHGSIDAVRFDGRNYYLLPDGPVGQKPYALLVQAMAAADRDALAEVAVSGRDQLVLLHAQDGLLVMSSLNFNSQLKSPTLFEDEVPQMDISVEEMRLAQTLIRETSADDVDFDKYRDHFTEKLAQVIEAKIAGEEVVAPPSTDEVHVVNLMDALRASVAKAKGGDSKAKPPKKVAASARQLASSKRKRKSS